MICPPVGGCGLDAAACAVAIAELFHNKGDREGAGSSNHIGDGRARMDPHAGAGDDGGLAGRRGWRPVAA